MEGTKAGFADREDRWVKEQLFGKPLVEKLGVLILAIKLSVDAVLTTFIVWTIFLVTWGVTNSSCYYVPTQEHDTIKFNKAISVQCIAKLDCL